MIETIIKTPFTLVLLLFSMNCTNRTIIDNQSTIINFKKDFEQCSRSAPEPDSFWTPLPKDIKELEKNIFKIEDLTSEACCNVRSKVSDINNFYRQYIGMYINGEKFIYINALNKSSPFIEKWKDELIVVCDGGNNYWGVIYDIKRKIFFDLAINGHA